MAKKSGGSKSLKIAKDGAVSDGKGGFLRKGDDMPEGADADSLKAKGLVE